MCVSRVFVLRQHVRSHLWHGLVGRTSVKIFEVVVTLQSDFISSGHQCGTSCVAACRCVFSFICEVPFQLGLYFTMYKVQKGGSLRLWVYSIQLCVSPRPCISSWPVEMTLVKKRSEALFMSLTTQTFRQDLAYTKTHTVNLDTLPLP